jgi:hypothetical protein
LIRRGWRLCLSSHEPDLSGDPFPESRVFFGGSNARANFASINFPNPFLQCLEQPTAVHQQNLPPTSGKVVLNTTVGDIDVELWTKEAPMACRNFVQLCLEVSEGYVCNESPNTAMTSRCLTWPMQLWQLQSTCAGTASFNAAAECTEEK